MMFYRRKFLINKAFQIKFICFALIPSLLSIMILLGAQEFFLYRLLAKGKELKLDLGYPYILLLQQQISSMRITFILSGILISGLFMGWGLIMSHKIAGPLFRFANNLKNVPADGKINKIQFRPGDFFQEIAESYNEFLKRRGLLKDEIKEDSRSEVVKIVKS